MAAAKTVLVTSGWVGDETGRQRLILNLEIDGVIVEGLTLRMTSNRTMPDRKVTVQIEHKPPGSIVVPLCRLEWRPIRSHRNYQRGPKEFRLQEIEGTHLHSFESNWLESEQRMLTDNLPIAIPISPDPEGFHQLLALVSKEFRIVNAADIPMPPWDLLL